MRLCTAGGKLRRRTVGGGLELRGGDGRPKGRITGVSMGRHGGDGGLRGCATGGDGELRWRTNGGSIGGVVLHGGNGGPGGCTTGGGDGDFGRGSRCCGGLGRRTVGGSLELCVDGAPPRGRVIGGSMGRRGGDGGLKGRTIGGDGELRRRTIGGSIGGVVLRGGDGGLRGCTTGGDGDLRRGSECRGRRSGVSDVASPAARGAATVAGGASGHHHAWSDAFAPAATGGVPARATVLAATGRLGESAACGLAEQKSEGTEKHQAK